MPYVSSITRINNRQRVLMLHNLRSDFGTRAIARTLGIHPASVHSILKNYSCVDFKTCLPLARKGAGRPSAETTRWKRTLQREALRHPFKSLVSLARHMYEWQLTQTA
jgi:predicted ArsR family transcriptional regulator